MVLAVLALSACGGDEKKAKARHLPEDDQKALRPGEYRSEEFKPSLSFRVVEGWSNAPLEMSDSLQIVRGEKARLAFTNVQEVFKPGTLEVVEAPKDMVSWFQHHPYLQTSKPESVTVGGVKGEQFDVVVKNVPHDYYGVCSREFGVGHCVDLFSLRSALQENQIAVYEEDKVRFIVLEDVKGATVTVSFSSPATEFNEFALEAQRVLDSVEWRGSQEGLGSVNPSACSRCVPGSSLPASNGQATARLAHMGDALPEDAVQECPGLSDGRTGGGEK